MSIVAQVSSYDLQWRRLLPQCRAKAPCCCSATAGVESLPPIHTLRLLQVYTVQSKSSWSVSKPTWPHRNAFCCALCLGNNTRSSYRPPGDREKYLPSSICFPLYSSTCLGLACNLQLVLHNFLCFGRYTSGNPICGAVNSVHLLTEVGKIKRHVGYRHT